MFLCEIQSFSSDGLPLVKKCPYVIFVLGLGSLNRKTHICNKSWRFTTDKALILAVLTIIKLVTKTKSKTIGNNFW